MTTVAYAVLLAVGVALLVTVAVRVLLAGLDPPGAARRQVSTGGSARRILEERYAAGEVTTEEYQHRLRVLAEGD